jgi:hypothetical protein
LDGKGEIPPPFDFERFNFNPHDLQGDFDYSNGKPQILQNAQGNFVDKLGRNVNNHGWFVS